MPDEVTDNMSQEDLKGRDPSEQGASAESKAEKPVSDLTFKKVRIERNLINLKYRLASTNPTPLPEDVQKRIEELDNRSNALIGDLQDSGMLAPLQEEINLLDTRYQNFQAKAHAGGLTTEQIEGFQAELSSRFNGSRGLTEVEESIVETGVEEYVGVAEFFYKQRLEEVIAKAKSLYPTPEKPKDPPIPPEKTIDQMSYKELTQEIRDLRASPGKNPDRLRAAEEKREALKGRLLQEVLDEKKAELTRNLNTIHAMADRGQLSPQTVLDQQRWINGVYPSDDDHSGPLKEWYLDQLGGQEVLNSQTIQEAVDRKATAPKLPPESVETPIAELSYKEAIKIQQELRRKLAAAASNDERVKILREMGPYEQRVRDLEAEIKATPEFGEVEQFLEKLRELAREGDFPTSKQVDALQGARGIDGFFDKDDYRQGYLERYYREEINKIGQIQVEGKKRKDEEAVRVRTTEKKEAERAAMMEEAKDMNEDFDRKAKEAADAQKEAEKTKLPNGEVARQREWVMTRLNDLENTTSPLVDGNPTYIQLRAALNAEWIEEGLRKELRARLHLQDCFGNISGIRKGKSTDAISEIRKVSINLDKKGTALDGEDFDVLLKSYGIRNLVIPRAFESLQEWSTVGGRIDGRTVVLSPGLDPTTRDRIKKVIISNLEAELVARGVTDARAAATKSYQLADKIAVATFQTSVWNKNLEGGDVIARGIHLRKARSAGDVGPKITLDQLSGGIGTSFFGYAELVDTEIVHGNERNIPLIKDPITHLPSRLEARVRDRLAAQARRMFYQPAIYDNGRVTIPELQTNHWRLEDCQFLRLSEKSYSDYLNYLESSISVADMLVESTVKPGEFSVESLADKLVQFKSVDPNDVLKIRTNWVLGAIKSGLAESITAGWRGIDYQNAIINLKQSGFLNEEQLTFIVNEIGIKNFGPIKVEGTFAKLLTAIGLDIRALGRSVITSK